jgi:hypothetical protein
MYYFNKEISSSLTYSAQFWMMNPQLNFCLERLVLLAAHKVCFVAWRTCNNRAYPIRPEPFGSGFAAERCPEKDLMYAQVLSLRRTHSDASFLGENLLELGSELASLVPLLGARFGCTG